MIRTDLIASVPELLRRQANLRGNKTAYSDARRTVSYKDLDKATANLAGHLTGLGLTPGDRLAILRPLGSTCRQGRKAS